MRYVIQNHDIKNIGSTILIFLRKPIFTGTRILGEINFMTMKDIFFVGVPLLFFGIVLFMTIRF